VNASPTLAMSDICAAGMVETRGSRDLSDQQPSRADHPPPAKRSDINVATPCI